jgi:hypothetical protein
MKLAIACGSAASHCSTQAALTSTAMESPLPSLSE